MATNFKPGDDVLIPARVLRMRGESVEMQLKDGQMVRTHTDHVVLKPSEPQPDTKAVKNAPQNKSVKPGENKGGRR
jgi:hypothetical protein